SPTTSTLAQDFSNSTSEFMENIRFRPLNGLRRLNFGIMALPDNNQPPTPSGPKKAASSTIINQGVRAMVASQADAPKWRNICAVSKAASRSKEKPSLAMAVTCSAIHGPNASNPRDRKSTRLNSSHVKISYAVFCLKKKKKKQ